ncbi:MAG: dephospho-CoA kinase [Clostridia bacterium]|nr:dephospho-CoA kinase [Clostridia bacterium]
MKIIGICGNSGSGKSTVCSVLRENGFGIIDCDKVYADLIAPPSALLDKLRAEFGDKVIAPDGTLDRKALSGIVFSDREKLEHLNSITFSYIIKRVKKILCLFKNRKKEFCVIDAPLLFESGLDAICDYTVVVSCPESVRLERLAVRDDADPADLKKRIDSQTKEEVLIKKCDFVIENFSGLDVLKQNTLLLIRTLERGGSFETY